MTELWLSGQQSWVTLRVPGTVQSRPAGFITLATGCAGSTAASDFGSC
jgi:hypothetical protein